MEIKEDFVSLNNFSREEIHHLISLSEYFKAKREVHEPHLYHKGKSIALIFEKPSTRTRTSLEIAAQELGLNPLYLYSETMQLARGEPIADTARVLSRYIDGIAIRTYKHETIVKLAKHSVVPVINALTDFAHPLQALGDLHTIKEFKGLDDTTVTFLGDGDNNVAHSLLFGCAKTGINFRIGAPEKYFPTDDLVNEAKESAKKSGGSVKLISDPAEAVHNSDVIYTDVWVSMGMKESEEERKNTLKPYRVTKDLLKEADPNYLFMHCLPRKEEVTNDVFESRHSIVWEQAENRLHSAKAVMSTLL